MADQEISVQKKRGRPRGRVRPETVAVRLERDALEAIDTAIANWPNGEAPSRSEVIRRVFSEWRLGHRNLPK